MTVSGNVPGGRSGADAIADRLLVALDVPQLAAATALVDNLMPAVRRYKVGLELFTAAGPGAVTALTERSCQVFIDLKLHDIPNTVQRAAARLAHLQAFMFTVHAAGGEAMMRAACDGARGQGAGEPPLVVAVTVLTSWGRDQWVTAGSAWSIADTVLHRAEQAAAAGVDGIVCSPADLPGLRAAFGSDLLYVCPGIVVEPAGADRRDHGRAGTPEQAMADGADFLVVGRPITRADDPVAAARHIRQRMAGA